jgi:O-antigen/teichoic acid export membrane protein
MINRLKRISRDSHVRVISKSFFLKIISFPLAFMLSIVVARMLKPESFGEFSFILAVCNFIAVPVSYAVSKYNLRQVSIAHDRGDWPLIRGMLRSGNRLIAIYCAVVLILGCSAAWIFVRSDFNIWVIGLISVPLLCLNESRSAVMRAFGFVLASQALDSILRPITALAVLGALFLVGQALDVGMVLFAYVMAGFVIFAAGSRLVINSLRQNPSIRSPMTVADLVGKSRYFILLGLVQAIPVFLPLFLLKIMADNHEIGIYRAADQFANYVAFGLPLANLVFASELAKSFANGNREIGQEILTKAAWFVLAIAVIPVMIFMIAPLQILNLAYGQQYIESASPLRVLSAAYLVSVIGGCAGMLLNMTGHEKVVINAGLVTIALMTLTSIILVPEYGATGQAFALLACQAFTNIYLVAKCRGILNVNTTLLKVGG